MRINIFLFCLSSASVQCHVVLNGALIPEGSRRKPAGRDYILSPRPFSFPSSNEITDVQDSYLRSLSNFEKENNEETKSHHLQGIIEKQNNEAKSRHLQEIIEKQNNGEAKPRHLQGIIANLLDRMRPNQNNQEYSYRSEEPDQIDTILNLLNTPWNVIDKLAGSIISEINGNGRLGWDNNNDGILTRILDQKGARILNPNNNLGVRNNNLGVRNNNFAVTRMSYGKGSDRDAIQRYPHNRGGLFN